MMLVVLATACRGSPAEPAVVAAHAPIGLPIVLSGQSNAVNLRPALAAAYAPGVISVSEANQRIREWAPGGPLWQQLEPELHRRLTAFVWWQGETDGSYPAEAAVYQSRLADLVARVRQANDDPSLLIVVVQILRYQAERVGFDQVREAQRAAIAGDANAILVSVDDLPGDGQAHLVFPGAYVPAAQRIVERIRALQEP